MEAYGKILLIAMPAFLVLVLFEKWWGWRKNFDTVRTNDMISSLSSGITNVTKDVLGLSVFIITYPWVLSKIALIHLESNWLIYFIAFMALDFAGYWTHRIAHEYNLFWNNHIIHHSSEEFNLACALRQSISSIVKIFAVFLIPAALLGVPANVIAVVAPLHLFAQFWYHTQHIGKMGVLEKSSSLLHIIGCTTPSTQNIWTKTILKFLFFGINYLAHSKKNCQTYPRCTVLRAPFAHGIPSKSTSRTCGYSFKMLGIPIVILTS